MAIQTFSSLFLFPKDNYLLPQHRPLSLLSTCKKFVAPRSASMTVFILSPFNFQAIIFPEERLFNSLANSDAENGNPKVAHSGGVKISLRAI